MYIKSNKKALSHKSRVVFYTNNFILHQIVQAIHLLKCVLRKTST